MQYSLPLLLGILCLTIVSVWAKPRDDEKKKSRVHEERLSDEEHFINDDHNPDYDHDAFLGEDEARTFDQLTPEESKLRLGKIVDKIDADNDGIINERELTNWIEYTQKKYIKDDVTRQWNANNPENKDKLDWHDYRSMVYGFMENMDPTELDEDEGLTYAEMLKRDERRWGIADEDKDGALNFDEFIDFLHPEEAKHMMQIVVQETIEDIDKDKDGKISLEEYIGDMYRTDGDDDLEPAWVSSERDQFRQFRDKNGDGFLDDEEVKGWIIPPDYNHAEAEAKHLIYEADVDGDKELSKEEIIAKYDVFVGSQATDFGEALVRHDEF